MALQAYRCRQAPVTWGPIIVAKGSAHGVAGAAGEPVPVRIKFYNLLPAGAGGNLFLPVDETVAGFRAGTGDRSAGDKYTQNRATIHLHGNNTVWISDGNTHQWITPANETTPYPKGVSARNVPDMPDCRRGQRRIPWSPANSGCQTFFYTNAQSARLQFYHDHAMGITRLNVYAGEAAGYVLTDAVEQDMINGTNVVRRQPWPAQGPPRHRHSPGHPGQDLGGRRHDLRSGPHLELGDRAKSREGRSPGQSPATSGSPTSTCPPRTRGTSPA